MTMFAADLPSLWLNDHKHAMCQGPLPPGLKLIRSRRRTKRRIPCAWTCPE